jgi:hypothetical protein
MEELCGKNLNNVLLIIGILPSHKYMDFIFSRAFLEAFKFTKIKIGSGKLH